jgi:hypothetical protein
MHGRKSPNVVALTEQERSELNRWVRCPSMPSGLVRRTRAVLLVSEGKIKGSSLLLTLLCSGHELGQRKENIEYPTPNFEFRSGGAIQLRQLEVRLGASGQRLGVKGLCPHFDETAQHVGQTLSFLIQFVIRIGIQVADLMGNQDLRA